MKDRETPPAPHCWACTAIESKLQTRAARFSGIYRYPRLLIAARFPLAFAQTAFIFGCWPRAGVSEPVTPLRAVLVSRLAYSAGMVVGGIQWLRNRHAGARASGPR